MSWQRHRGGGVWLGISIDISGGGGISANERVRRWRETAKQRHAAGNIENQAAKMA
jgi:hypothetical protein